MTDKILDVAVVGGGISGVYAAWRLQDHAVSNKSSTAIELFELSDQIGGRLISVTPPGMPDTRCELGGMRFTSSQKLVNDLVQVKLDLDTKEFPVQDANNIAYLRGKRLTVGDLDDPEKLPYNFSWWEKKVGVNNLMAQAVDQIIPGGSSMNDEQWSEFREKFRIEGKYLYDMGYWNFLLQALSSEGYAYMQGSSGYYSPTANWNAYDAIRSDLADFGAEVKYFSIKDGYQELPVTLATQFVQNGGTVKLEHRLTALDTGNLPDGSAGLVLQFEHGNAQHTVYAKKVILAMPRTSLEGISRSGALLGDSGVQKLIASVTPAPFFKLFVCYPYPWWEELGLSKGQSVTDIPLRQCYYWDVAKQGNQGNPNLRNAVLLASYDDRTTVDFWGGLTTEKAAKFAPDYTHIDEDASHFEESDWSNYQAPQGMVDEIHRQLLELHGVKYAPKPYAAAFKDWSGGVFGGGVNFWNIHVKSWETIPRVMNPNPDLPVYICGSAYSNFQGWVEGALQTSEQMLETHFDLPRPDWYQ